MRWRNDDHGYGIVTKVLHWSTVALLLTQLTVGYVMDDKADAADVADVADVDCDPAGEELGGGRTSDAEEERLDQVEDRCEQAQEAREEDTEDRADRADRADADDAVGAAWSDLWTGDLTGGELTLAGWHVVLGLAIVAVGVLRVVWRRTTPLPPWDSRLTETDRVVLHRAERILLALLFVVPATGIALVVGSSDLVPLHVAAHLCFYAALVVHVGVVVRRRVVGRMLWGRAR
ncbi:cytochrome b/b6 domain-containing protein [Promicromonospora vindobonensis]|uniref:Cytochrome b/b6 domain-containing protein n=1 Tax=Promicromonospora vindobonensis TaxID=195748 RepID=A0ABW5VQF1_9MICO